MPFHGFFLLLAAAASSGAAAPRGAGVAESSVRFKAAAEPFASVPDGAAGRSVVSLAAVLEIARSRAPAIAAARARITRAEESARSATRLPDPRLTAGYGRASPRDAGD